MSYNIIVKYFDWDKDKNTKLKKERNISFEEIAIAIKEEGILDIVDNPSGNFPNQKVYVIKINQIVYYVPFVEDAEKILLKTIIPSRKLRKKYLRK